MIRLVWQAGMRRIYGRMYTSREIRRYSENRMNSMSGVIFEINL